MEEKSVHTVEGEDGKNYSISSVVSVLTGYLRRPRIHSREKRFYERLPFLDLSVDPRGFDSQRHETILHSSREFIYVPRLKDGEKDMLEKFFVLSIIMLPKDCLGNSN